MTNYVSNEIYLLRNTSMTVEDINFLPFFHYELLVKELREQVSKENDAAKKQQTDNQSNRTFTSMASQLKSMFNKKR